MTPNTEPTPNAAARPNGIVAHDDGNLDADGSAPHHHARVHHLLGHPLPVLCDLICTPPAASASTPAPASTSTSSLAPSTGSLIDDARSHGETVDLFHLSLRRPVYVFGYPCASPTPSSPTPSSPPPSRVAPTAPPPPASLGGSSSPSLFPSASSPSSQRQHDSSDFLVALDAQLGRLASLEPHLAVFGLSTEPPPLQREVSRRLSLRFALLSDPLPEARLCRALDLPTVRLARERLGLSASAGAPRGVAPTATRGEAGREEGQEGEAATCLQRIALLLRGGQVTRVDYLPADPSTAARKAEEMLTPDEQLAPQAA